MPSDCTEFHSSRRSYGRGEEGGTYPRDRLYLYIGLIAFGLYFFFRCEYTRFHSLQFDMLAWFIFAENGKKKMILYCNISTTPPLAS